MAIADVAIARFFDPASGRFYDTANDHEALITRPRDVTDNATPSGNSLMADLLMRLSVMTGEGLGEALALAACRSVSSALERHPSAFGHLLGVADMALYGATEVVLVGDEESASFRSLREVVAGQYLPSLVLAGGVPTPESPFPLLHARSAPAGGSDGLCVSTCPLRRPDERPHGAHRPARGDPVTGRAFRVWHRACSNAVSRPATCSSVRG
jgi:uncharacterized protein YyaL (SSP411 family)